MLDEKSSSAIPLPTLTIFLGIRYDFELCIGRYGVGILFAVLVMYSRIDIIPLYDDRTAVIFLLTVYKIPDLRLAMHHYNARQCQVPDNILDVMS